MNAMNYAWHGGKTLSNDPNLKNLYASQHEYEEEGSARLHAKFNPFCYLDEEPPKEEPGTTEEFSYLNYWKNEGVDIFQKGPQSPLKDPEYQFKLEGENIEEYDGQYVNLDFEIEKPVDEKEEQPSTSAVAEETVTHILRGKRIISTASEAVKESPSQAKEGVATPSGSQQPTLPKLTVMQKLVPIGSLPTFTLTSTITTTTTASTSKLTTLTSISPQLLNTVSIGGKSRQIVISQQMLQQSGVMLPRQRVLNSNIILPKLTRIQPRIIRPLYKSMQPGTSVVTTQSGKITQYISLGNSVIVPSTSGSSTKTVVAPSNLLGNTVIVPQNMLASKNLTFQIIPIKPNMVSQANIILTQTKTTKD